MSYVVGMLVSSRIVSLHELQTVYSTEDAYLFLDILNTDNFNRNKAQKN